MQRLKKVFVLSVLLATVLSMSVVVGPANAAVAQAGDLIKMDGLSSVYYLGADGKRYVFPNEQTYFSWYSDFSGVVTVPQSELESYPLGANVTMRPGTKLVKITTDPKVYAVEPDGNLLWVPSETVAKALWGNAWASTVVDVPDAFFTNYTGALGQVSATAYPTGSLVKFGGVDIFYIEADGTARKIANEAAFAANRFNYDFVVDSTLAMPTEGTPITGAEGALSDTSSGAGGTAGAGTGLSVALSSTTAQATSLIIGQTNAKLASFNLTASNDGSVTVNTVKVKRTGISADATLSEVYLYEGVNRLTENASVSSGYATFNNLALTVAAGQTRTLTVVAKIAGSAGETLGISMNAASDVVTNGASVSGSFPINGNTHSISSATLATVAFNASTQPSAGSVDAGESDFTVWKNIITVGNRKANLESVNFRQIGSISNSDLANLRFFVDGVQYGNTMELGSNGYVMFQFATPVVLQTGSRTLEVRGNVVNGATRTFSLSLRQSVDVMVRDSEYGAYISATALPATSGSQTVNSGSLIVSKATDSPSGNVVKDASGVTLAKYELKAFGEAIKIEYLKVDFTSSNGSVGTLRNGALFANGVQVGSTADLVKTTTTNFSLGSSLVVTPGSPVMLEVRADVYDNDGTNSLVDGNTLTVSLDTYTNAAQRQSSLSFFDVPTADLAANPVTVQTGSMTVSKYNAYGNQTIAVPQSSFKIGQYTLSAGSSEDVNLNTFTLGFTGASVTGLTDVFLKYGDKQTTTRGTVSSSTNFSVSETLAASANMTVEVYATLASTLSGAITSDLAVSGITAQSASTVTVSAVTGQSITAGTPSLSVALDANTAVSALVKGGSTVDTAAYKWTATTDGYTIKTVDVHFPGTGATTAIAEVQLKDGSTVLATAPVSGATSTFSGLTVSVPANSSKVLTIALVLGNIGTGFGSSGADLTTRLDTYKAAPVSTGADATTGSYTSGNALYVYKSVPTITNQTLPTSVLAAGTNTFAKFSIAGDGNVAWKYLKFNYTTSAPTLASAQLWDANTNTQITGSSTVTASTILFEATSEQEISGAKTYILKATAGGTIASGAYVSVSIPNDTTTFASSVAYASAAGSFIWSDMSANGHDTTTADWSGDFKVKNLPTDSQTLTK